jgi:hypothetical protein
VGTVCSLGKLQTERLVPVDPAVRHIVRRILTLRALAPAVQCDQLEGLLVPRCVGRAALYYTIRTALADARMAKLIADLR